MTAENDDGGVWPGSAYDKHIDACGICRSQFEPKEARSWTDTPTPAPVDLTPEVLARWEELAAMATEGPWFREYGDVVVAKDDPRDRLKDEPRSQRVFEAAANWNLRDPQPIADAKFVVAARAAVPALLAGVRSRDARIAELEAEVAARDAVIARLAEIEDGCDHPPLVGGWCNNCEAERTSLLSAAPSSVLAARDAETAAKALEKAAGEMPVRQYSDSGLFSRPLELGDIRHWLRARAAEHRNPRDDEERNKG